MKTWPPETPSLLSFPQQPWGQASSPISLRGLGTSVVGLIPPSVPLRARSDAAVPQAGTSAWHRINPPIHTAFEWEEVVGSEGEGGGSWTAQKQQVMDTQDQT